MDPIDENVLIDLAISGGRTPVAKIQLERLQRLAREGYVEDLLAFPIKFVLSAAGYELVEKKLRESKEGAAMDPAKVCRQTHNVDANCDKCGARPEVLHKLAETHGACYCEECCPVCGPKGTRPAPNPKVE